MLRSLVGSEMCIRDSPRSGALVAGGGNSVYVYLPNASSFQTQPNQTIAAPAGSQWFGCSLAVLDGGAVLAIGDWGARRVSLWTISDERSQSRRLEFTLAQTLQGPPGSNRFGCALSRLGHEAGLAVGDSESGVVSLYRQERANVSDNLVLDPQPFQILTDPKVANGESSFGSSLSFVHNVLVVGSLDPRALTLFANQSEVASDHQYEVDDQLGTKLTPYTLSSVGEGRLAVGDFRQQRVSIWNGTAIGSLELESSLRVFEGTTLDDSAYLNLETDESL
eukprot:TRINITY_DN20391_c0_g1_i10.p1 TRINITY_DN20391_c0_g1~~TRINITY_DN20391_c0_g1_i10.p1  ORF type:complete len:279 (+),score=37.78 TRINITY_DN20391_c0_g1_i10:171-1007(+)